MWFQPFDVGAEPVVLRPGKRLHKRALDRTQPYDHVVPRPGLLRRLARVLVGQRLDEHPGKLLLDVGGHGIDETHQRSGGAPFFLLDCHARLALAAAVPVVLADRDQARLGLLAQQIQGVAGQFLPHGFVRQAQLGMLGYPFVLDQRIPLWMLLEVLGRRKQRIEGVDESRKPLGPARLGRDAVVMAVESQPRGEGSVQGVAIVDLAVPQRRRVAYVERPDVQNRSTRREALLGSPPAAADRVFEERVNGVEHAVRRPTRQHQLLPDGLDHNGVVGERFDVELRQDLFAPGRSADENRRRVGLHVGLAADWQLRPGHGNQMRLKLPGGGPLDRGGRGRQDDRVVGLPITAERERGIGGQQRDNGKQGGRQDHGGISGRAGQTKAHSTAGQSSRKPVDCNPRGQRFFGRY